MDCGLRPSRSVAVCSGLLSVLFAYSAVVQLDDYDWYIWLPFYSLACLVCLVHTIQFSVVSRVTAYIGLICGLLLFIKVVNEGCLIGKVFSWVDFVSLDMEQKLVREKLGSLLVCLSMWVEITVSGTSFSKSDGNVSSLHPGMLLLVLTSGCLCATYFTQKG